MNGFVKTIELTNLNKILNSYEELNINNNKSLALWKMDIDDQPIFRYIYRNVKPRRHLEFGTWQGAGLLYCLEECSATVWTINLPFGEFVNGDITYGVYTDELESVKAWANKIGFEWKSSHQTDTFGFIGRHYLNKSLGNRVCQIYCDSRDWDTSNYPKSFFDSVLVDGGHQTEVVKNDTEKSIPLLRSGGIMIWHDYCPPVYDDFECVKGVIDAIELMKENLSLYFKNLYWINPSWILFGIKK
ncbi:class I SAM-dependent methyltransferase [Deferribacteraceae bacterium V6Fe1]|nr:class I SAM-dependent methyltransferase [Deferribacteraceae bacterium V6Fe1]